MHYRLAFILLTIFIVIAYIDTKSLQTYFSDYKILKEYSNSSKLIGIGIVENEGQIKVKDVITNTPAEKSGLEVGDVVLDIDGQKANSAEMIKKYLGYIKKNQKIALTIQKPDKTIVEIRLTPTSINNFE